MAFKTGISEDYLDLLAEVKRFTCGYADPGDPAFSGAGTGVLSRLDTFAASVAETWTLSCTAASAAKATVALSLTNADAETGDMTGWTQYDARPQWEVINTGSPAAYEGTWRFQNGNPVGFNEMASYQRLDLLADGLNATDIDDQACVTDLSWRDHHSGATNVEEQFFVRFLDSGLNLIEQANTDTYTGATFWTARNFRWTVPVGCRYIDLVMVGYRSSAGGDANVDDIALNVDTFPARFSVVGSVSGSAGNCSAHDQYQKFDLLSFFLTDPNVDFEVGDEFTVAFTTGLLNGDAEAWTETDFTWRTVEKEPAAELHLEGPGLSGTHNIFVGFRELRDPGSQVYSWRLEGYTGHVPGFSFNNHPGAIGASEPVMTGWDQEGQFWIFANGNRVMLVAKMGSVYSHMYMGFMKTYYTPNQFPYPLVVAGSTWYGSGEESYTSTSIYHQAYWNCWVDGNTPHSALRLRGLEGGWKYGWIQRAAVSTFADGYYSNPELTVFPWYQGQMATLDRNLDGSYPIFPAVMVFDDEGSGGGGTSFYGELHGLYGVPGRGNASENTLTIGGDTYLVFQSTYDTGAAQFCAIKQE